MSFLTTLANLFVPQPEELQTRQSEFPSFEEQLAAIRQAQAQPRPWRQSGVNEALSVPSILSAVSLISGVVGTLSMEGFRDGELMSDAPRLIQRPNPRSTPGVFYRDTAFYLATRGEAWWWIPVRDTDGLAMALYPIPPWEITVEQNDRDRLNPTIRWLNRIIPNDDIRHLTYLPDSSGLRGLGPLQLAGTAVSVTVEASEWAANFFAGALPSLIGTTDQDLDEVDLKALDAQWAEKPGNLPRWMTQGMKLEVPPFDAQKAQLTESRSFQVGEVARMFMVPGPLLEYQMSGSSLTYRNEEDIWTDFQRRCLSPKYLEPIEQEMSDLMPRTTVGRFNLKQLLRADAKTRSEIHKTFIEAGVYGADTAAREEGYAPGNVDYAPVPFSPPQAEIGPVPYQLRSQADGFRCSGCNKKLAESAGPGTTIRCRCGILNAGPELLTTRSEAPQITVNPANVTIESGAIAAPDMSGFVEVMGGFVQAISDLAARNEAPAIHFEAGAFQSHIDAPDMSGVADALTAVADRPQPDIHVDAPAITVEAPQVTVNVPESRGDTKTLSHDENGRITEIVTKPN